MTQPLGANMQSAGGLPRGELLGRYTSYLDAQKLVDYLADNDFPVSSVTIVGNDLRTVERVTAKLSYPKVALAGAAQGAMMGFFVGLLLSLFSPDGGLYQILSAIGLGMAIWMIAGVVSYSMRRGKRDFASSSQFVATSYDVVVDFANAQKARALASKLPMHPGQAPAAQPPAAQPPAPQNPPASTGATAAAPGAPAEPQAPSSGPSGTFPDLPDGRPRYGVRVNQPQAAPGAEQQSGQEQHPEGQAPQHTEPGERDESQAEPVVIRPENEAAPSGEPQPESKHPGNPGHPGEPGTPGSGPQNEGR
ncbi:general stress protein [Glutamicibacter sp. BSL13]